MDIYAKQGTLIVPQRTVISILLMRLRSKCKVTAPLKIISGGSRYGMWCNGLKSKD